MEVAPHRVFRPARGFPLIAVILSAAKNPARMEAVRVLSEDQLQCHGILRCAQDDPAFFKMPRHKMRIALRHSGDEKHRVVFPNEPSPTETVSLRIDRFEMKFAISAAQRAVLMAQLAPHLRPDENAGAGAQYPVVSLYYDNADRDCYWEKARGLPSRRKLRVRVYGSRDGAVAASAFVEIKHKCEGRGVKRRVQLPLAQALRVCEGHWPEAAQFSETDARVIREAHDLVLRKKFHPVLLMRYERSAYAAVDPGSDLRVTFDSGVRVRFDNLTPEPDDRRFTADDAMHGDDAAVMEVKVTGCIPYWLSCAIAEAGCRMQSHSKYSSALEQNDPVLRAMLSPNWRAHAAGGAIERSPKFLPMTVPAFAPVAG